jgi:phosphoribosylformimino-5-aminoimidazole carboxamide ribotide isomerase
MLIPSIDLRGGKVVQLVQGERLALESDDLDGWVRRFSTFPRVQVIDLDAATGTGSNAPIVADLCRRLPCRVGGGVRSADRARELVEQGAREVIAGSALFKAGAPDLELARALAEAVGLERLIAAIDARQGQVVVHGWRTSVPVRPAEAARLLEPWCGGFLYTHVDTEGLMQGIDMEAVLAVRRATSRPIAAAGGITTRAQIDELDALGIDAVVGMALYTGVLEID